MRQAQKTNLGRALATLLIGLIACQSVPESTTKSIEAQGLPGEGVKISSAHSNWIEEHFQTAIVNLGLEKLGYQIKEPKELDYPAIHLAVANGDLDYTPVHGDSAHEQFFQNSGGEEKLQKVGVLISSAVQGYQIDKKTADKYNITNLEQFKKPEIAKLFDFDRDGKANLTGCNPGWGCQLVIEHHIDAYGLRDTFEQDTGQYTALLADTMTRYQQGEPVLFYAYNPHWISSVLIPGKDVVWLEVPFTSVPEFQGKLTEKDTLIEGKNLGFAKSRYRIIANNKFLAANPVAKRWFELVQISVEDMNAESLRIKDGEDSPEDIRRHAEEWVEQNQQLWDRWLEEAKQAAS
ncbi:MAG: glycine betaine/L-proline ABC transporter substrate-binding protein ProX [Symploca sp. SIO2E9]|nr:glycine betaine/L-proline ABC transporter substrate-binding protein ProX [Symploca sp. SIO2E9]